MSAISDYILIAEDDEDDQLLLRSAFRETSEHHELRFVTNGIELIEHFRSFEKGLVPSLPTLLIVDLNMPKKNGREAISELVSKDYFREFPTVIFSTTSNEFERQRCLDLGVSAFYVKPPNYTELVLIVKHFSAVANGGNLLY